MNGTATTPKSSRTYVLLVLLAALFAGGVVSYRNMCQARAKAVDEQTELLTAFQYYQDFCLEYECPPYDYIALKKFVETTDRYPLHDYSKVLDKIRDERINVTWGAFTLHLRPSSTANATLIRMPIIGTERAWVAQLDGAIRTIDQDQTAKLPQPLLSSKPSNVRVYGECRDVALTFYEFYLKAEKTNRTPQSRQDIYDTLDHVVDAFRDSLIPDLYKFLNQNRIIANWGISVQHVDPASPDSNRCLMYIKMTEPEANGQVLILDVAGRVHVESAEKFKEGF